LAAAGLAAVGLAAAGRAAVGRTAGRPVAWITFGSPGAAGLASVVEAGAFGSTESADGLAAATGGFAVALAAGGAGFAGSAFFATFLTVFLAPAFRARGFLTVFLVAAWAAAFLAAEMAVGRSARPEALKLVRRRSATSASMPLRLDLTWMPIFSRVAMISSAGTPVSFASL
jgi:hypothetical protein